MKMKTALCIILMLGSLFGILGILGLWKLGFSNEPTQSLRSVVRNFSWILAISGLSYICIAIAFGYFHRDRLHLRVGQQSRQSP